LMAYATCSSSSLLNSLGSILMLDILEIVLRLNGIGVAFFLALLIACFLNPCVVPERIVSAVPKRQIQYSMYSSV